MKKKAQEIQSPARRLPRQARSQLKIELMFEAAMRLLDDGDVRTLTTNAVAERAGVSIGTLYQYFGDKESLLDALVERELGDMAGKVMASVNTGAPMEGGERLRRIVSAVVSSYGGRNRVHRQLIAHTMSRTTGRGLAPMYAQVMTTMISQGVALPGKEPQPLTPAQAFVQTYAIAGVLRNYALSEDPPPKAEIEDALMDLIGGFMQRTSKR